MNQIAMVLGIGLTAIAILYFGFLWDKKEHVFLRLIVSFVFVSMLFFIPSSMIENQKYCDFVVNSTITDGSETQYTYDYKCNEKESHTAFSFFRAYIYWSIFFVMYFLGYLIYLFFIKKGNMIDQLVNRVRKR